MNNHPIYSIDVLSVPSQNELSNSLNRLFSRDLSGIVIKNFISNEEVVSVKNGYRSLSQNIITHINSGFDSYPMSFAQLDQMVQRGLVFEDDYFKISNHFITNFNQTFGINFFERLKSLVHLSNLDLTIDIPQDSKGENKYVPFTFRELFPGDGCLKAHCENLFYKEFPSFFNHINRFSTQENQLSFFLVLQNGGSGGELTLFDLLWEDNQRRTDDTHVYLAPDKILSFDNEEEIKRDMLKPEEGSLVVFYGGNIWHRVEMINSGTSRLTLGGFMSFSHDGSKLFCWS